MKNLSSLFEIWFQDKEISVAELLAFTSDHLGRLTANNAVDGESNAFDTIIAETASAYAAMGGATSSEAVALAVRQARTFAKATHLELIKDTVSRRAGGIAEAFGKKSVQWIEFFPAGVEQYRDMKEAEVLARLDQFIAAATTHRPTLLAEFNGLRATWVNVSGQAAQQTGTVGSADTAQDTAAAALRKQLMKNALTIALFWLTQQIDDAAREAKAAVYFDQSKLRNPVATPEPPPSGGTPSA